MIKVLNLQKIIFRKLIDYHVLLIFLIPVQGYGEAIEGFFYREVNGTTQLILNDLNSKYHLKPSTILIEKDLNKLNSGDFLRVYGEKELNVFKIESISFVGLKSLIGLWKTLSGDIFYFYDFSKASICTQQISLNVNKKLSCIRKEYIYRIVPGIGSTWSIFLAQNENIKIGTLIIKPVKAELTIYNEFGEVEIRYDLYSGN